MVNDVNIGNLNSDTSHAPQEGAGRLAQSVCVCENLGKNVIVLASASTKEAPWEAGSQTEGTKTLASAVAKEALWEAGDQTEGVF